jgi:hypothetical protein
MRMKIDGGCHCGAITYEAEIDPRRVIICHCTDCQTFSGAPYRVSVQVLKENFRLTGEPRVYRKRGDSGAEVETNFCPSCGTAMFSTKPETPSLNLRWGSVRQRADLPPMAQGFLRSALPWSADIAGVPIVHR